MRLIPREQKVGQPMVCGVREEGLPVRRGPSPHRLAASAEGTNPTAEEEGGDRGRRVLVFVCSALSAAVHQMYGFAERYTIIQKIKTPLHIMQQSTTPDE